MSSKQTKASIITIGDEILVGQTIDTNSAWIAAQLNLLGISVNEIISISDKTDAIEEALTRELSRSNLVFITGGLGPTQDDITKKTLTDYFNDELVVNTNVLRRIEDYFNSMKRPVLEVHRMQAALPKKARIIENQLGTASGMWFKKDGASVISLPGVPYEMKGLMEQILPILKTEYPLGDFYHKTILLQGIGETTLAQNIADIETECRSSGIGVAYLPSPGIVKLRLSGTSLQKEKIETYLHKISNSHTEFAFGQESDTLESVIGNLLRKSKSTVGSVESCTGGALAAKLVSVSGSSDYYKGSMVSYAYELKENMVGVDPNLINKHGAVSQECVEAMAQNGLKLLNVDYCVATSGIAGPAGGTLEKPVGTVWIAIASKEAVQSKVYYFKHNRERNIELTVVYALNMLRRKLLNSL
jgi:nicotinamide-nucleotide amidase